MGTNQDLEESLWQRSLLGDGDAFGLIFDLHRDRVIRHSLRFVKSIHEAEDVTAIVFFELWRKRKTVRRVDGSVLPWLLVTATNVGRNECRSRRRYQALLQKLPHGPSVESAEDQAIQRADVDGEIATAISQLSTSDVYLFTLIAVEGYSPTDAAEVLGKSSGNVRTRMHRIRARLHRQLGHNTLAGYLEKERA